MNHGRIWAPIVSLTLAVLGCGSSNDGGTSSDAGPGPHGDAAAGMDSGAHAADASVSCAALGPGAGAVTPRPRALPAPGPPSGGTIADGVYDLVQVDVYPTGQDQMPFTARTFTESIEIRSSAYRRAFAFVGAPHSIVGTESGTFSENTQQIVGAQLCKQGDDNEGIDTVGGFLNRPYSATAGSFILFEDGFGSVLFTYVVRK